MPNFFNAPRRVTDCARLFVSSSNWSFMFFPFVVVVLVFRFARRNLSGLSGGSRSLPNPAEEDAGDVGRVHLREGRDEVAADRCQAEIVAGVELIQNSSAILHVKRAVGQADLVSPVSRI